MRFSFLLAPCLVLVYAFDQTAAQNRDIAMLSKVPYIDGHVFDSGAMVQVVNHLRQLGKEKSLAVLKDYLATSREDGKVLIICRLLFVNPNGWDHPGLGDPVPAINPTVAKQFPLFPIAVSDRVPFLLLRGYRLEGRGESAMPCLKLCEGLALVKEDYRLDEYEKSARALIQMEPFDKLYKMRDRQQMADMILGQAKKPLVPEKKLSRWAGEELFTRNLFKERY